MTQKLVKDMKIGCQILQWWHDLTFKDLEDRINKIQGHSEDYNAWFNKGKVNKQRQEKYDKDYNKYLADLDEWKKQPSTTSFEIKDSKVILNDNKLGNKIQVTATGTMLIKSNLTLNKWEQSEGDLIPVDNSKILVGIKNNDKYTKTICISLLGLPTVLNGNVECK